MQQSHGNPSKLINLVSLVGEQGSGKSTIGKVLAKQLDGQFVEASDIVTELCGYHPRGEMHLTNARTKNDPDWLARGIEDKFNSYWLTIISGIREPEVHQYFEDQGYNLVIIELWCPQNERFARVKNAGKVEHYSEFMEHSTHELGIGLKKILDEKHPWFVTTFHSIDEVASEIAAHLGACDCNLPI